MNKLRGYLADAARAFDRAPVEVALALFTAIAFSYGIEHENVWAEVVHLAVAIGITLCIAWSATITHASRAITTRSRWIITGTGALFAAVYLLLTPDFELSAEHWRAFILLVASVLTALAAPALVHSAEPANLRLRRINGRLFLRAAGIALYGLALFGGLALALAAIDNLFELKLHEEIYAHVFVWIMLVLVPWVIVGGLDDYVRPLDEQSDIARVVYRLATWLVPVLVAIYLLILYVYAARILATGELPKNLVSPMVIAAGLLTLITLVLFDPPADAASGMRWLRYPILLYLPLAPLGFWALVIRSGDYGWTEFRLLRTIVLVVVLMLAVVMAIHVVRRRPFPLRLIPAGLAVALALSVIGPWSVLAISRRDQQQRLAAALNEAEVDLRVAPVARDTVTRAIPAEQFTRIENLATYLHSHFGAEAVTAAVPAYEPALTDHLDLTGYFGLRPIFNDSTPRQVYARFGGGKPAQLAGGVAYRIEIPQGNPQQPRTWSVGDSLRVLVGADTLRADLAPAFAAGQDTRRRRGVVPPMEMMALPVRDASGRKRGDLLLLELNMSDNKGTRTLPRLDAMLIMESQ